VTPLGSVVNLASGATGYPWRRFVFWEVFGECLSIFIYIGLGMLFSDRVMSLDSVLGEVTWAILALTAAASYWAGRCFPHSAASTRLPGKVTLVFPAHP
jgi:membrane protein DedA with SNARE-associated domain